MDLIPEQPSASLYPKAKSFVRVLRKSAAEQARGSIAGSGRSGSVQAGDNIKRNLGVSTIEEELNSIDVADMKAQIKPKSAEGNGPKKPKFYRSDFKKALEPKVQFQYEAKPGQTPRKVEIERRKRLYSSQRIEELINREAADLIREMGFSSSSTTTTNDFLGSSTSQNQFLDSPFNSSISNPSGDEVESRHRTVKRIKLVPGFQHEEFVSLEFFDDTEYDPRTKHDWLDMKSPQHPSRYNRRNKDTAEGGAAAASSSTATANSTGIVPVKIPVPAKAFHELSGNWKDCLVLAYDEKNMLWKVRWRNMSGWELDKINDFNLEEEESEDAEVPLDDGDEKPLEFITMSGKGTAEGDGEMLSDEDQSEGGVNNAFALNQHEWTSVNTNLNEEWLHRYDLVVCF